jgi:membrane protease YdiL (CAAX protease family)
LGSFGAFALSTTLFALAHVQYDFVGLISVGFFGACACFLAWRTGSILPGIILHALYNFVLTGGVYLVYQAPLP